MNDDGENEPPCVPEAVIPVAGVTWGAGGLTVAGRYAAGLVNAVTLSKDAGGVFPPWAQTPIAKAARPDRDKPAPWPWPSYPMPAGSEDLQH